MRWTLAILAALILLSLSLSALHSRKVTVGEELHAALDRPGGVPLRTALILMDFSPDQEQLAELHRVPLERGDGPLSSTDMMPHPDTHWARNAAVEFTWQTQPTVVDPLRRTLADPEGAVQRRIVRAIHDAGYYNDVADHALSDALISFTGLSDEALLQAYLHADRDMLPQRTDLPAAVRESLLITADLTTGGGPVLILTLPAQRIYILPLECSAAGDSWLQLLAFDSQAQIAWSGTLRVKGPADPARTRTLAALMAEVAAAGSASPSTSRESRPQGPSTPVPSR